MISDGFGPASETYAREYLKFIRQAGGHRFPINTRGSRVYKTALDELLVGQVRTWSASSLVTDSAAGATAYSCAIKTYNGAIAVDERGRSCKTVLERAHEFGIKTALVVTSRITHATPAGFSAHVEWRDMESEIALHQVQGFHRSGPKVDLMMGGGKCFLVGNETRGTEPSCREDQIDLWKDASTLYGWNQISTRKEFDRIDPENVKYYSLCI